MTECDEVAANMLATAPRFDSFDAALLYVRAQMPDESRTITRNVAWSLWLLQQEG